MRTLADFDNFRKRSERERQEGKRYALAEPLREFLGVVDNLDLALAAGGSAEDLKRGVEMIHRQMQDLLRRFGVQEVEAAGAAVRSRAPRGGGARGGPHGHTRRPSPASCASGYRLHDRLLRPSMVKVAVPPERPAGSD